MLWATTTRPTARLRCNTTIRVTTILRADRAPSSPTPRVATTPPLVTTRSTATPPATTTPPTEAGRSRTPPPASVTWHWAIRRASPITTGSDNIILGAANQGVAAENGVIRIGNKTYQKKAFIAGIRGVTTGSATASTVFVDVNGQLGTIKSSRRYKEDIQSMDNVSEKLFGLRPVTFRYTQPFDDGSKPVQYGLIAEEVAEVMPELVVYGEDGKPETVSYHLLATLLLNEVQKDHRVIGRGGQRRATTATRQRSNGCA